MKRLLCSLLACCAGIGLSAAQHVIRVAPEAGDMTRKLQAAIEQARDYRGQEVVIELQNADYHLYRQSATARTYYCSNTTSETENPDPTKHIGLWFNEQKNITVEGNGARLVTHGELTSFVIDHSENIRLRNLTVTAADPTVPELTVTEVGEHHLTVRIHPQSRYEIDSEGRFAFVGDSWRLSQGIAQTYDPEQDITWRSWSPLSGLRKAIELEPGLLRFVYDSRPQARAGQVFQMRDGIRDEVCGLIQYSKDVTLEQIRFAFLGNFSVLSQMKEPKYGYALVQSLEEKGVFIDPNTLYPLLRRLEGQGLLESRWETGGTKPRKYYRRTEYGTEIYEKLKAHWTELSAGMGLLLKEDGV